MLSPRPVPGTSRAFESSDRKNLWKIFALIFDADANTVIFHPEMDNPLRAFRVPLVIGCFRTDEDLPALRRILVRVADQIGEHLSHAQAIRPDRRQKR